MATTASPEASEIRRRGRRRLIGAVVLVVLAVVFVPMILDSEPRPKRTEPSLDIPPKDKAPLLPPPTKSAVMPVPAVAPVETGAQQPSAQAAPKPEPKPAPAKAETPTTPKLEGFAVQVGAFKDEDKLNQARQKLMAARIPHFVERRGDLNRLRAGPYQDRAAAEKALAAVKAASLEGQVVPLP
jgi:DedD protein